MMYAKAARGSRSYRDTYVHVRPKKDGSSGVHDVYRVEKTYYGYALYDISKDGVLSRASSVLQNREIFVVLDYDRNSTFETDDYRFFRPVLTTRGISYIREQDLVESEAVTTRIK